MSIYHGLAREEEVASWLLWERNSLTVHPLDHPETISAMKRNVVLQLLVCKSFQCGTFRLPYPPTPGEWGRAVNLEYYRTLPPGYRSIVTAKIAEDTGMHGSNIASADAGPAVNITRAIKALSSTKSSCAVCGARRAQDGSKLSQCSKCYSALEFKGGSRPKDHKYVKAKEAR
ncbi:hypothetical protein THAOC_31339 [Thalassiosira oceanica]|uniref:Uncharacterized protein n=1 Tax=Thalassiosira oceanica TaxID=159749 RepID=K0RLJ5_THAOC|nr:hypothetical protein THAOC_31339 [Thalassiosira oceanica]|eukprot:EJK49751.1 hypothetical protein THAOC_31339 [Thalassiosira oceanica]